MYGKIIIGGAKLDVKKARIEIRLAQQEKKSIEQQARKENLKAATFMRKVVLDYIKEKEDIEGE